jgi:hypothetical protein
MQNKLPSHRTFRGCILDRYGKITKRSKGKSNRPHLYIGLEIMPKETFLEWSLEDADYKKVYDEWVLSDFDTRLAPSVNRIDSLKGYVSGNIEWITHAENSSLGSLNRWYGGHIR